MQDCEEVRLLVYEAVVSGLHDVTSLNVCEGRRELSLMVDLRGQGNPVEDPRRQARMQITMESLCLVLFQHLFPTTHCDIGKSKFLLIPFPIRLLGVLVELDPPSLFALVRILACIEWKAAAPLALGCVFPAFSRSDPFVLQAPPAEVGWLASTLPSALASCPINVMQLARVPVEGSSSFLLVIHVHERGEARGGRCGEKMTSIVEK